MPKQQIGCRNTRHRSALSAMADKLQEGDTIAMQGEVTLVHDDGTVTVRLTGYSVPVTTRGEHLNLVAKKRGKSKNLL